VETDLYVTL